MPFIPPPPKELQKDGEQPQVATRNVNKNKDIVRPMEESAFQQQEQAVKEGKEEKEKPKKEKRARQPSGKGKLTLCIVGVIASVALIGFIVYLLAF